MRKTFKYKAIVSKEVRKRIKEHLFLCRKLYNACLEERISAYKMMKISLDSFSQKKNITIIRKENPEYKNINSQILQDVAERIDKAFKAFFKRCKSFKKGKKPGHPRFKSRDRYHSFTFKQSGWELKGKKLKLQNLGTIQLRLSREIVGKIKTVTVKMDVRGNIFVTFSCETAIEGFQEKLFNNPKEIALDMGLTNFFADSEENLIAPKRPYVNAQKELRREQRSLSRKKRNSKSRYNQKKIVSKVHARVVHLRDDFHWKLIDNLIKNHDIFFVEDLKIREMIADNKYLAKDILDASWRKFLDKLRFKVEETGKAMLEIDPKNTSQMCHGCDELVVKTLKDKMHVCPKCRISVHRDINAAKNILKWGRTDPRYVKLDNSSVCIKRIPRL